MIIFRVDQVTSQICNIIQYISVQWSLNLKRSSRKATQRGLKITAACDCDALALNVTGMRRGEETMAPKSRRGCDERPADGGGATLWGSCAQMHAH